MITDIQPNISFKSSPKVVFLEMISFELRLEKWYGINQKPLWFRGFSNRYPFRFALLVAGTGCGCPVDTSVQSTKAPTEAAAETLKLLSHKGSAILDFALINL